MESWSDSASPARDIKGQDQPKEAAVTLRRPQKSIRGVEADSTAEVTLGRGTSEEQAGKANKTVTIVTRIAQMVITQV